MLSSPYLDSMHQGAVNSAFRYTAPSRCVDLRTSERASMEPGSRNPEPRRGRRPGGVRILAPPKTAREVSMNKVYEGSCFCGAVKFTVSGDAVAMGYCHCDSCRSWSAAPVNAFTLWPPSSVVVT